MPRRSDALWPLAQSLASTTRSAPAAVARAVARSASAPTTTMTGAQPPSRSTRTPRSTNEPPPGSSTSALAGPSGARRRRRAGARLVGRGGRIGSARSAAQSRLDGRDDPRPELVRVDDGVDRPDADGAVDAVDAVELRGDLAELLAAHRRAQVGELGGELGALGAPGLTKPASTSLTRGSPAVRASTSRENTTAAAGAPPMTEANEPSIASTVMLGLSALEKTTNAPPW